MNAIQYIKDRAKERDTQTVAVAAIYTVVRMFVPVEYQLVLDTVAGLFGVGVMATPNKV